MLRLKVRMDRSRNLHLVLSDRRRDVNHKPKRFIWTILTCTIDDIVFNGTAQCFLMER